MKTRRDATFFVRAVFAFLLLVGLLGTLGCTRRTVTAEEGELTCVECHLDRELLKADLKADPPPEVVKAESEGEG